MLRRAALLGDNSLLDGARTAFRVMAFNVCVDQHRRVGTREVQAYEGSDPFDLVAAADVFGYVSPA